MSLLLTGVLPMARMVTSTSFGLFHYISNLLFFFSLSNCSILIYGIYFFKCLIASASFQIVPLCPFLRILIFFSLQVVDRIHLQQIFVVPWVVKVFHLRFAGF